MAKRKVIHLNGGCIVTDTQGAFRTLELVVGPHDKTNDRLKISLDRETIEQLYSNLTT